MSFSGAKDRSDNDSSSVLGNDGFWKPKSFAETQRSEQQRSRRRGSFQGGRTSGADQHLYYYSSAGGNDPKRRKYNASSGSAPSSSPSSSQSFYIHQLQKLLPISKHRTQILYSLEQYGVIVLVGETGCGKSTQLPQYMYHAGWCDGDFSIVCTQPRRLAAQTLAERVGHELAATSNNGAGAGAGAGDVRGRQLVGYTVRFDDNTNAEHTKIKFVTDGILLREATLHDPLLSKYSIVMVDEAHERNLNSDALLGLLKRIREKRPTLRIVICSATIQAQDFLDFFIDKKVKKDKRLSSVFSEQPKTAKTNQPTKRQRRWDQPQGQTQHEKDNQKKSSLLQEGTIISVDGRLHSVDIFYVAKPVPNYIEECVDTALKLIHRNVSSGTMGNILCFFPSAEDVDQAMGLAETKLHHYNTKRYNYSCLPLYASLPQHAQRRVFQPPNSSSDGGNGNGNGNNSNLIIFATNLAETSVTIPNVTHVIDTGLVKLPYFDPRTGMDRLLTVPTSQASAQQRAGRAGRISEGQCYRLYTEKFFLQNMPITTPPEISRSNITSFLLTLKALGVDNILSFELLNVPSIQSISHGLETLYALGALRPLRDVDDISNNNNTCGAGRHNEVELSDIGWEMSSFPTEPRVSRMLMESLERGCAREVALVASALQVRSLWLPSPKRKQSQQHFLYESAVGQYADQSGDHITNVNILEEFLDAGPMTMNRQECQEEKFWNYTALVRAREIYQQLWRFLRRHYRTKVDSLGNASSEERSSTIRICITAGFFFSMAKLHNDGRYYSLSTTSGGSGGLKIPVTPVGIFATHGSYSPYIIFCETQDGTQGGIEVRSVSSIDPRWLRQLAPHYWE